MAKMFKQMGKGGLASKDDARRPRRHGHGRQTTLRAVRSKATNKRIRLIARTEFKMSPNWISMTALQDQLDEITANTRHLVQAERLAVGERAVAELFATGIEDRILPVGAAAPEFALNDATGRLVRSADLLALGPLVIKFFRGRWCPYCVTELETWRDLYGTLREREALMVAIGPQTERQSDFMAGQHGLPFPVLTRPRQRARREVRPRLHRPRVPPRLLPLHPCQHSLRQRRPSWRLPIPATYVIAKDRKVLFAEAHADFRVRPEPEEALAAAFAPTAANETKSQFIKVGCHPERRSPQRPKLKDLRLFLLLLFGFYLKSTFKNLS